MWYPSKVDRLERELKAATGDTIHFYDHDTRQRVSIQVRYGLYLVDYLNEQLSIPLDERQHAN